MSRARHYSTCALVGLVCFAAGAYVAGRHATAEDIPVPREVKKEDPPNRSLDANLWMQISAEYRACCYQGYNLARRRLAEKLNDPPPGGWAEDLFGREWIIFPNPAYGEWAKVLGLGADDRDRLTGQSPRRD
jgi:predicted secreted acid phosphatase